jgi:hypothetical protein
MSWLRRGCSLSSGLLLAFAAAHAQAQESAPRYFQVQPVPVQLAGGEGPLSFRLSYPGQEQIVAQCPGQCSVLLWPGQYTLYATDASGRESKGALTVDGPRLFVATPPSSTARSAGLALGIVGIAAVGLGFLIVVFDCGGDSDNSCDTGQARDVAATGLLTLAAGAVMAPIGWVMYAKNRDLHIESRLSPAGSNASAHAASASFGVVPLPRGGFGFGAAAQF